MASSVLSSLSMLFVVAGLVLFFTSLHLDRRARGYRRRMKNLLQLVNRDIEPLDLPAAAWPELADGGWKRMEWRGTWFGQPVSGALGAALAKNAPTSGKRTPPLIVEIHGGEDVQLVMTLTHGAPGGETRMFAEHLARVFMLILETRMHIRSEALSVALAERARLSLYLQHDMRNLAQWVSWVSTDFAACTSPDALHAAACRLRANAPLARERAERLIMALGQRPMNDAPSRIDLRLAVVQAAQLAGIGAEISGEAHAWVIESLLARALDNLFSNLAAIWRAGPMSAPSLRLDVVTGGTPPRAVAEIRFHCPWPGEGEARGGPVPLAPERLFEPFASGRPGGLGLGLYQARKSLREADGDLHATSSPAGIEFLLQLPAEAPQSPPGTPP